MNEWKLVRETDGTESFFDSEEEAEQQKNELTPNPFSEEELTVKPAVDSKRQEKGSEQSDENVGDATDSAKEPTVVAESQPDDYAEELPDDGPSVDEDPLVWMPDEFTDTIKGTTAINRKGFEVLAHHYDIQCDTEHVVLPSETDYEYAVVKATAVDADGDTYGAYGEADISEADMERPELLRYADTRAYKRAISRATGVGMVAVSELQAGQINAE